MYLPPLNGYGRALAAALITLPICAQDSVSKTGCLPGDGLSPYDDAAGPNGSEQTNQYTVNLSPFITSWGTVFGIAPVAKASFTTPQFFGSFVNSQGISRRQALGVPFASTTYSSWIASPGAGINNDPSKNDPGTPVDKTGAKGHQFAIAFSEGAGTGGGADYEGIISALVNVEPGDPGTLYVSRTTAAINACDELSELSDFGFGSIEEDGHVVFRCDNFIADMGTSTCGTLTPISGNNVFRVDTQARDGSIQNVISQETLFGTGFEDAGATNLILGLFGTVINTPGIVPGSVTGGNPLMISTDFNGNFVRGSDPGSILVDQSHFSPITTDQRGNMSYTVENYAFLSSTHGVCGVLGKNAASDTRVLNLFGIDAVGNVLGTKGLELPTTITDNSTGFTNPGGGLNEFGHYFSQVAFAGGNGQIAMGQDQAGRLLVSASVDHPSAGASNIGQYLVVVRLDPASGTPTWTIAAYNDGVGGGKPILDGPGGNPIGQITDWQTFLGASLPGISPPAIDAAGNLWFIAVVEIFDALGGPSDFGTALLRAVYDPATFSYELELVFDTGTVFSGLNSGRNYQVSFLTLNDSNSLSSGTIFSQNISHDAHLSQCPQGLAPSDARTLGGLVISAEITYDFNVDAQFIQCTGAAGDPTSPDQDYNVVLYIGALNPGSDLDGNGIADEAEKLSGDGTSVSIATGGTQNLTLCAGPENAGRLYVFTGTTSGTTPGFPFGGFTIPLNPDFYTLFLINAGSTPFGPTILGNLDAQGKASAAWSIPPGLDPALAGFNLHHAYAVFDATLSIADVSNPWPLSLLP